MDHFAEQLVKKQQGSGAKTRYMLLMVCGILLTLALIVLSLIAGAPLTFVGFLLAAAVGYGTYFKMQGMYIEYEYTFTNGELDVDKIIAKKKRKEMLTVNVSKFSEFGRYSEDLPETKEMTVVIASDNIASNEYYADFTHEEYGETRLIFSPDEKMIENIKTSLPRTLRAKLEKEENES